MRPTRIMGTRGWRIGIAMVGAITVLAALVTAARMGHAAATADPAPGRPSAPVPSGAERFVIDPAVSTVAYRVGETALSQNRFHAATGVTNAIQGTVDVDLTHPQTARIGMVTVDLSQLRSDSARRDSALRTRWLESPKYPTAAFTPIAIKGLPDTYTEGRVVPVRVTGFFTVHTVSQSVTFAGTVAVEGATLTSALSTTVRMTDFGFAPPSLLGVFRVDDDVVVEVHITAHRVT
jgi:polyisoprenoid-binding protein YceI